MSITAYDICMKIKSAISMIRFKSRCEYSDLRIEMNNKMIEDISNGIPSLYEEYKHENIGAFEGIPIITNDSIPYGAVYVFGGDYAAKVYYFDDEDCEIKIELFNGVNKI